MIPAAHELEDGAHEVVEGRPLPRLVRRPDIERVAKGPPHANLQALREAGKADFIDLRLPTGSARISMSHAPVAAAIARLQLNKRAEGLDDGVSPPEVSAVIPELDPRAVYDIMRRLKHGGVLRSQNSYRGYQGQRTSYRLTAEGVLAIGIAEQVGPGARIQIGGLTRAWKGRNQSEPDNVFQHAALLRKSGTSKG